MAAYVCDGHDADVLRVGAGRRRSWSCCSPGYALGGGIIVCALTTRYRDLAHLVAFGIQLLMYRHAGDLSAVERCRRAIARLLLLNPLTPIIEGFRKGFLGVGTVTVEQLAASGAVMLVTLVAGVDALQPRRAHVHGHGLEGTLRHDRPVISVEHSASRTGSGTIGGGALHEDFAPLVGAAARRAGSAARRSGDASRRRLEAAGSSGRSTT